MLNGLYGYLFGEEIIDGTYNNENEAPSVSKRVEDDWYLVEDCTSGRSSPVMVPNPELEDIDSLSMKSEKVRGAPTAAELRKAEALKQAKALTAQRIALENALFAEVPSTIGVSASKLKSVPLMSSSRLKRGATQVDTKPKQRSKKAGKMCSGVSNDRKVNNI